MERGWTHGSVSARRSEADPAPAAAAAADAEADAAAAAALKSPAMPPLVAVAADMTSANAVGSNGSMFSPVFLPMFRLILVVGDGGTNAVTDADSGARKSIIRHAQRNIVAEALFVGRGIMVVEKERSER